MRLPKPWTIIALLLGAKTATARRAKNKGRAAGSALPGTAPSEPAATLTGEGISATTPGASSDSTTAPATVSELAETSPGVGNQDLARPDSPALSVGEEADPDVAATPDTPGPAPHEASHHLPPSYPPLRRPEALAIKTTTQAQDRARRRWRPASTLLSIVLVIACVALLKTFVVQWFTIPSGSMEDTLKVGDRVAVTMFDSEDLQRGDVIVFRDPDHWLDVQDPTGFAGAVRDTLMMIHLLPQEEGHHLIKRIIGMPGDHVYATGAGPVYVNGVALKETYVKDGRAASEVAFDVIVPDGYVWVMGDNRSNSSDSRFHQNDAHGGCVPLEDVVGVAKAVVWPLGDWRGLGGGHAVFADVPDAAHEAPAPATPAPEDGA